MKVSYVTPFYSTKCDGRFGRFHDWIHTIRDSANPDFDFHVHTPLSTGIDSTLSLEPLAYLGTGDELWATRKNKLEQLLNLPRLRRDLRRADPDIVHMISIDPILLFAVRSTVDQVPLVAGPNIGGWFPNRRDDIWFTNNIDRIRLFMKFQLRKAMVGMTNVQQFLAFSEYHREMLKCLGMSSDAVTILSPGVEKRFSPPDPPDSISDPPEILYVGDLTGQKGYELFLQALERLDHQVYVRIVGAGDPNMQLIRSLKLSDFICIEGFVDRSDLPTYYQRADLVVIPSIDEMGPNTQVEALATGTPLVTTDTPGVNEYPPSETAELFWPHEVDPLATAINQALERIESLSRAARTHAPKFSARITVSQLDKLYHSIL